MNAMPLILFLLAATGMAQTDDLVWCPVTENYLNHAGSWLETVKGVDLTIEDCEALCDARKEDGCNFVWLMFPRGIIKPPECRLFADADGFKPRIFLVKRATYSGRLCVENDPKIPCKIDRHCYRDDYCNLDRKSCEPKCNLEFVCGPCESCYDLEDSTQECRADGEKCPLTEEPTEATSEPTEEPTPDPTVEPTEEPTEATEEPTQEPTLDPTAEPTEATEEPTAQPTAQPTAEPTPLPTPTPTTGNPTTSPSVAPTPQVWCPPSSKYLNHRGGHILWRNGLADIFECDALCDETPNCNFVWFFDPVGIFPSRCRLWSDVHKLKPRLFSDHRPITYDGRLCGVHDPTVSCRSDLHCYRTDVCNMKTRICEAPDGTNSLLVPAEDRVDTAAMVDRTSAPLNSGMELLKFLLAAIGVMAALFGLYTTAQNLLGRKTYTAVPDLQYGP